MLLRAPKALKALDCEGGADQVPQITIYVFRRRAFAISNFAKCYLKPAH